MKNEFSQHVIKGMQRDLSFSKFNPEFAFENMNIRITARDDNSLLSITNEKGNISSGAGFGGIYLGHTIINNSLIIFSRENTSSTDHITQFEYNSISKSLVKSTLYSGSFGFNMEYPIQALGVYESENIQKVYWVDGKNQPRVINIKKLLSPSSIPNMFNFIPELDLNEIILVNNHAASGEFLAGTIQYCFSYYNLYGQESNIFYTSPLNYIGFQDRGAAPNTIVSTAFKIDIAYTTLGSLPKFEYLRIYSIHRTSKDSIPTVKVVTDIRTSNITNQSVSYIDTGRQGYTIDPSELLYKGGEEVVFSHICTKDNTLFLGNYTENRSTISQSIINSLRSMSINQDYGNQTIYSNTLYNNQNSLTFPYSASFKRGEWYRLGVQFQYKNGKWSEPIFIRDVKSSAVNTDSYYSETDKKRWYGFSNTSMSSSLISQLSSLGFKRVRPVVVFPTLGERVIKCQGIVSPTEYSVEDRVNNSPFAYASPVFRSESYIAEDATKEYSKLNNRSTVKYKDIQSFFTDTIYKQDADGNSIVDTECVPTPNIPVKSGTTSPYTKNPNSVYMDKSIVTFNSPDIEFDTALQNLNTTDLSFRVVGYVVLNEKRFYTYLDSTAPKLGKGFLNKTYASPPYVIFRIAYDNAQLNYSDEVIDSVSGKPETPFFTYLWHRKGSLNNDKILKDNGDITSELYTPTAILNRKIVSDMWYSKTTGYLANAVPFTSTSNIEMCYQTESSIVKLKVPYTGETLNYSYIIDKVITPDGSKYPIYFFGEDYMNYIKDGSKRFGREPVSMKFKSSAHAAFSLGNSSTNYQYVLPHWQRDGEVFSNLPWRTDALYENSTKVVDTNILTATTPSSGGSYRLPILWLGEIYDKNKDSSLDPTTFGGTSDSALEENQWLVAGDPVDLNYDMGYLTWRRGDTYYQRYDCLKTYPYTDKDTNSLVEICSFMCETRVNLDGRYDRNKNLRDNTSVSPTNFNLMNDSYTQLDNFFNYRYINPLKYNNSKFPNVITWTKSKFSGDTIDQWTSITLASTIEMDGDKGEVSSLNTINNDIVCFQPKGISKILFNSRIQVQASDGVPIEIANSGKVDGKVYITNTIGTTNKWSIRNTPQGVYFIDGNTKDIYLMNTEGIVSLTDKLGFRSWTNSNLNSIKWSPWQSGGFKTFYDSKYKDVYFINDLTCLCYSELLGQFTSFFSYENTFMMDNIGDKFIAVNGDSNPFIYFQNDGTYNMFYGVRKDYYTTFISNNNPQLTKIFNVLEFRSDMYNGYNVPTLDTFNEVKFESYSQKNTISLNTKDYYISNLKKKFGVWRVTIPRDMVNTNDRFRSPWLKITLKKNTNIINDTLVTNTYKMELHDILVHYFN